MRIPLYQVDTFTDRCFAGNPAAVCPLDSWLPDELLQEIAAENNLSETAYLVAADKGDYHIRWFTPTVEVDLCGHATLASSWVLFNLLNHASDRIVFHSRSGPLTVRRQGRGLEMDFPVLEPELRPPLDDLATALGAEPEEVLWAEDYLAVFATEEMVRTLTPDFRLLAELDCRGVIVTAAGETADFVSRFFAPRVGINEDPVTGSAHCVLTPYWSRRLGKSCLSAHQVSRRGGSLQCELAGERVLIRGKAVLYLEGRIRL